MWCKGRGEAAKSSAQMISDLLHEEGEDTAVIFFCYCFCCFGENDCQNAHLKLRYPPYFVLCFVYC